jgi:hypothetical protein
MLVLADIVEGLLGLRPPELERRPTAVVVDSRLVGPDGVFVALRGERAMGTISSLMRWRGARRWPSSSGPWRPPRRWWT